ncbi:hypothetical protein GCM10007897_26420 [Sphingobium jiangsuense]|nr:hypothetical protein GCM10007897_26420 [Sphingobium jiangsuense]
MRVTRRALLRLCGAMGATAAMGGWPLMAATTATAGGRGFTATALFLDQPYGDGNGLGTAYRPPAGARGMAALASRDEAQIRFVHFYI